MKSFLLDILRTRTVRQSGVTFLGTIVTAILGFVFYIVTARTLGKANFGIFSVSVLVLTLIADIANVGTDTGIVKFVGKHYATDRDKALKFLKLGLKTKVIVSIVLVTLGWFLVPFIAGSVFQKPEFSDPLRIALLGSVSALLFSFATSTLQAIEKFGTWSVLTIGMNAARLAVVYILFVLGIFTLNPSLVVYSLIPLAGFLIAIIFMPNFWKVKGEVAIAKEFFHYNKWVAAFVLIAAISGRLDSFISTRFLSLSEVGTYSVAVSLAAFVPQVVLALGTVVAPKLASFDTQKKAYDYLVKLQLFVLGLAFVGLLIGIPLSSFLIPLVYGSQYSASVVPFIILIISQAIFLISVPAHTAVIYYFSYPKLFVWISLIHLIIVGGLGWFLIYDYGYIGAAVTVLVGSISNFLIPFVWSVRKFSK